MIVGVLKETFKGERRVALVPASVTPLAKKEFKVLVEKGAGNDAGYLEEAYSSKGAEIVADRADIIGRADILLYVRGPEAGANGAIALRRGQILIGQLDPLGAPDAARGVASAGITSFSLELLPRITRAQSMDVLSSMATIAGYKAVLLAADQLPKMFPLMMTAAGNITPARVFIVGVGVAGLQAIATSRRLGAVVHAYDVRPTVKEQVESLGARFVELALDTSSAEDRSGYSKAMDEEFYEKQREMMSRVVAESDVVITTAAVPGRKSPILVTEAMVQGMHQGSVIVDLAAERGGNCELTRPGETIDAHGVRIVGPLNISSTVPFHASQMYSTNITNFLLHVFKKPAEGLDLADQITADTLLTRDGEITNARVREALKLPPLAATQPAATEK